MNSNSERVHNLSATLNAVSRSLPKAESGKLGPKFFLFSELAIMARYFHDPDAADDELRVAANAAARAAHWRRKNGLDMERVLKLERQCSADDFIDVIKFFSNSGREYRHSCELLIAKRAPPCEPGTPPEGNAGYLITSAIDPYPPDLSDNGENLLTVSGM